MKFHFQQAIRAFILLSFSVLLFKMHYSGEITRFINPKYEGLSQYASVIFLILFFIQITRIWSEKSHHHEHGSHKDHHHDCDHHHDHGDSPLTFKKAFAYFIIIFPLLTGFLLPSKVLDAAIAEKKGGMSVLAKQKQASKQAKKPPQSQEKQIAPEEPVINEKLVDISRVGEKELTQEEYDQLVKQLDQSPSIVMNDDLFSSYYDEISMNVNHFKGRKIELKGFIYSEDGLAPNQLVIARFLITHCAADAGIIGFLSKFSDTTSLTANSWIEAKGVLDTTTYKGTKIPYIKITKWKKVKEPKEPYLYPINVKIL
ncbi:TIGR03943 family protein [Cytobacillus sp. Hz8]|uniref:TIGR03943 family putative permease subunit n=1 Tax=Cytobacillus sp. Hz8 TaxID=3347168 RepID=UPI0035DE0CE7